LISSPSHLLGLWRRSLLVRADGARDVTTRVCWLQGLTRYIDLRQAPPQADFTRVLCLNDLTHSDCQVLAGQEGFAGQLVFDSQYFLWLRQIDFQPQSAAADAGSLAWESHQLVERGRESDYLEHWHRDEACATQPYAAVVMRELASGTAAQLIRLGDVFMYARDRSIALPSSTTLTKCVVATTDIDIARAMIDCEISLGTLAQGNHCITASTLPYRIGFDIAVRIEADRLITKDIDALGASIERHWKVAESEGKISDLCT
jgi:hypothetical protein